MKLFLLLALVVHLASSTTTIWHGCTTLSSVEYCADLIEHTPCNLNFRVTIGGILPIMDKPIDLAVAPEACTTYAGCEICLSMDNITKSGDTVHACVGLSTCNFAEKLMLECFTNTGDLAQCISTSCPNGCSGNGDCETNGVCTCNPGWTGEDCSQTQMSFDQCATTAYGDMCLVLEFEDCAIDAYVTLASIEIYNTTVLAPEFSTYFGGSTCANVLGCSACLYWNNFVLNTTYMRGCPAMNMSCVGSDYGPYLLNCFEDTNLVPSCFGTCPKNCSGKGTCSNGQCNCNSGWQGTTCAIPKCDLVMECSGNGECIAPNTCKCLDGWTDVSCEIPECNEVNNCSSHGKCISANKCGCDVGYIGASCNVLTCPNVCSNGGKCVTGKCQCAVGWDGTDCTTKVGTSAPGSSDMVMYIAIGVSVLVLAAGVGTFVLWRQRRARRQSAAFMSLDDSLLQADSEPSDQ